MKRSEEREREILRRIEEKLSPSYQIHLCIGGHDINHIRRMCRIAEILWNKFQEIPGIKNTVSLFLLKIAIWFHNSDRSLSFENLGIDREQKLIEIMLSSINYREIDKKEVDLIVDAVKKHSAQEQPGDSALLRLLRYCDMLDMGAVGIGRIFSHQGSERHPEYNEEDLSCESSKGSLKSGLKALDWAIEWQDFLPKELLEVWFVKKRFAFMRMFREAYIKELNELNITS